MKLLSLAVTCGVLLAACVSAPTPSERGACVASERALASSDGDSGLVQGYALVFDGFTPDDMRDAEDCFVILGGYMTHRPTYTSRTHSEFWYETTSGSARLTRNLKKMLDRLSVSARVAFSGNEYTISKIKRRKSRQ